MFANYLWAAQNVPEVLDTLTPRWTRPRFRNYARDLRRFRRFCLAYHLTPYPASVGTMLRYIRGLRRRCRSKSIRTMLQPIAAAHRELGFPSPRRMPLVQATLAAWQKEDAVARTRPPTCSVARLREICGRLTSEDPLTRRDHATITVAFWGMLDGIEVAALDLSTCRKYPGYWVFESVGTRKRRVTLDRCSDPQICPIDALERWLRASGISSGTVFRQVSCWTGPNATKRLTRETISNRWFVCTAFLPRESQLPFGALRAGMLEASFHAGVSLATLGERGGYRKNIDLIRRLRRVVTPQPGDRALPPAGRRAPTGRRGRRRPKQRAT